MLSIGGLVDGRSSAHGAHGVCRQARHICLERKCNGWPVGTLTDSFLGIAVACKGWPTMLSPLSIHPPFFCTLPPPICFRRGSSSDLIHSSSSSFSLSCFACFSPSRISCSSLSLRSRTPFASCSWSPLPISGGSGQAWRRRGGGYAGVHRALP